jgi:uncharacterized protein DUF1707/uncharacterized protein DUF4190
VAGDFRNAPTGGYTGPAWPASPAPLPMLRVTDRDREATVTVLQGSYSVGRLTREEHDTRVGQALAAQTYPQLAAITADLPDRPVFPDMPVPPGRRDLNGFAVAALICGAAQPVTGMLTTLPAIAFGHIARSQIKRSGQDGRALATWGLALGWVGLAIVALLILTIAVVAVRV